MIYFTGEMRFKESKGLADREGMSYITDFVLNYCSFRGGLLENISPE